MKNALAALFPFFLCLSCVEDIDLDTGEDILNVYCVLNQGPVQSLELTTITTVGRQGEPVNEAQVDLYDEENKVGQFEQVSDGKWAINYSPLYGHTYRLDIQVRGRESLSAETVFPQEVEIQEIRGQKRTDSFRTVGFSGLSIRSYTDLVLWCYYAKKESQAGYADYVATDHPGVDTYGITSFLYDIIQSHQYYPDFGVNLNVFDTDKKYLHEKSLRIFHPSGFDRTYDAESVRFYSGYEQLIPVDGSSVFMISGLSREEGKADLVISVVNEDYDLYLKDCYREWQLQSEPDFSVRIYKRNFYSNIVGGAGIFAAAMEYRREVQFARWDY